MIKDGEVYCKVCGFPWRGLDKPNWMYEICPSCGIQYGLTDTHYLIGRAETELGPDTMENAKQSTAWAELYYVQRRAAWVESGMKWRGGDSPPPNWNPVSQLLNIGVEVSPLYLDATLDTQKDTAMIQDGERYCRVCGLPWPGTDIPHWMGETCPCCMFGYGRRDEKYIFDRAAEVGTNSINNPALRSIWAAECYTRWRERWAAEGMEWRIKKHPPPSDWNPVKQLLNINVLV